MKRKENLITGEIYHIFNRSIAEFKIFNRPNDFTRMKNILRYYQFENIKPRFSEFIRLANVIKNGLSGYFISAFQHRVKLIQIISYCIMPTHLHIALKQLKDNGTSTFVGDVLNSYARYFNTKHKRKGPLWEGRFKNVRVDSDEQLLHLTRYIHLNPVTAYLVDRPTDWNASSYNEYLLETNGDNRLCYFQDILNIRPSEYKRFVEDRIAYQREIGKIKNHLLD